MIARLVPIVTVVGFLSALLMTMQMLTPPKAAQRPAEGVLKADRLEAKEVRVIPITAPARLPAAALTPADEAPALTARQRIAMADPLTLPPADTDTAGAPSDPDRKAGRGRHYGDICAAHGMRKVERGRGWRCVHARR